MSTRAAGARAERRALSWYRLRGWRILATNVWVGGYELDLIVRRGRRVAFVEVKAKTGRRLRRAAEAWLVAHPELASCAVSFDVVAEREGKLERLAHAF